MNKMDTAITRRSAAGNQLVRWAAFTGRFMGHLLTHWLIGIPRRTPIQTCPCFTDEKPFLYLCWCQGQMSSLSLVCYVPYPCWSIIPNLVVQPPLHYQQWYRLQAFRGGKFKSERGPGGVCWLDIGIFDKYSCQICRGTLDSRAASFLTCDMLDFFFLLGGRCGCGCFSFRMWETMSGTLDAAGAAVAAVFDADEPWRFFSLIPQTVRTNNARTLLSTRFSFSSLRAILSRDMRTWAETTFEDISSLTSSLGSGGEIMQRSWIWDCSLSRIFDRNWSLRFVKFDNKSGNRFHQFRLIKLISGTLR